jgi:hypothetical protein
MLEKSLPNVLGRSLLWRRTVAIVDRDDDAGTP